MRERARSVVMFGAFVALAALACASRGAAAQPATLDALLAAFRRMPGLSADFREEKSIALLREPVVSTGRLYFAPPSRLARHVRAPSPSSMVLDGAELRFGDARGAESMDLEANPAAGALVDAFRAVLAGDRAALVRGFDATLSRADEGTWRMRLVPRQSAARRLVTALELTGAGVVLRTLEVREATGDVSRTVFSNVDANRRFSRAELRRLFRVGGG